MPMNVVNKGCANGLSRHRSTNVVVMPTTPPGPTPSLPLYAAAR